MHIIYMWVHSRPHPSVHPHPSPKSSPQLLNLISLIPYSAYDKRSNLWLLTGSSALHLSTYDLLPQLPKKGWSA